MKKIVKRLAISLRCLTKTRLSLSVNYSSASLVRDFSGDPTISYCTLTNSSSKVSRSIEARLFLTISGSLSIAHCKDLRTYTRSYVILESVATFC